MDEWRTGAYLAQRTLQFAWKHSKLVNHDGPVSVSADLAKVR